MLLEQLSYKLKIDTDKELSLSLGRGVFVPTGTTAVLVKAARSYVRKPGKILDLGCGCGVVGIALHQMGLVSAPLYASDVSDVAVDCAKKNAALYNCPAIVKCGQLFDPWKDEKFDYIINDVSGVAAEIAKISPWFNGVPCESGADGTSLVLKVIEEAGEHLNKAGLFFFPVISFSNVNKILTVAREKFSHIKQLVREEWPLPKEMYQHLPVLKALQKDGRIQFKEKFGMVLWFTDVYVAYNSY